MINLEEEARKRRERLKSTFSNSSESTDTKAKEQEQENEKEETAASRPAIKEHDESFEVPEGEVLLDASGAEILSLDSKLPDTLEEQVNSLLSSQNDLIYHQQNDFNLVEASGRNSDLKREYERRMTGLTRQTRRAVVDIVRARLEREKNEEKE